MACAQVHDYLQTQGLKLSADQVQMAMLAAQSVLTLAQAEIDMSVIWYQENGFSLAEKLSVNTASLHQLQPTELFTANNNSTYTLRQMYLALDSIASRHHNEIFALYFYEPDEITGHLYRLLSRGGSLPAQIYCGQQQVQQYLFVRTATTGWLNQVNNVQHWLSDGSLTGEQAAHSQLAIPVTNAQGQVLGVLYAAHMQPNSISETELIDWTALAIVIPPLLQNLHQAIETSIKR